MTQKQAKKWAKEIAALAEGKTIQIRDSDMGTWKDISSPMFAGSFDYRIKPESKLRPWRADEVPVGAVIRNIHEPKQYKWLILNSITPGVAVAGEDNIRSHSTNHLMRECEHTTDGGKTWLPCGVEEVG